MNLKSMIREFFVPTSRDQPPMAAVVAIWALILAWVFGLWGCGDVNGPNQVENCPAPWQLYYGITEDSVARDTLYYTVQEVCARSYEEACELLEADCD